MVKLLFFLVILVFEALFSDVMDFDVVLLEEKLRGEAPIKKETPAWKSHPMEILRHLIDYL